jgi:hypothetical protein
MRFFPGFISGGKFNHDCGLERCILDNTENWSQHPSSRSIGFFLEGIIALAPFAKVCRVNIEVPLMSFCRNLSGACSRESPMTTRIFVWTLFEQLLSQYSRYCLFCAFVFWNNLDFFCSGLEFGGLKSQWRNAEPPLLVVENCSSSALLCAS